MSGYTPVFSEIYMGSLYGRWPAAAVWASLLPLCDKNGVIDASPQAIAGMTGWPLDLLMQGITDLLQPDPDSRTPDEDGRRLMPLEGRPWGWRVVNHGKYREKARLSAKNAREVEEGRNAERLRDRRRPPETAADPLSNANANSDAKAGTLRSSSGELLSSSLSDRRNPEPFTRKREERKAALRSVVGELADRKKMP